MARKKKSEGAIRVVNLQGYTIPQIKEDYRNDWVTYGEDNNYFGDLIDNYLSSPTNSCCINGIVDMIYGRGLSATDSEEKPEMFARFKMILKDEEVKKLVNDYKLLGQAAVQVVYNKSKTRITSLTHFPMETLRAEKADEGKIKAYYYHPKWSDYKPCLLYTSPSPRDRQKSRMPSSA